MKPVSLKPLVQNPAIIIYYDQRVYDYDGYQLKPNFWKCENVKINSENRKSRKASLPILKLHRPIPYIFVACI
jgi:hypothetical protein